MTKINENYLDDEIICLEHTDKFFRQMHASAKCEGESCTIHNRSDHHMRSFVQGWRADRGIMERICQHGVGHPDPDDYKIRLKIDDGVHGCDGCCLPLA